MGSSLNNQDISALLRYVMRRGVIGREERCIKEKEDAATSGQHRRAPETTLQSVFKLHFKRVFSATIPGPRCHDVDIRGILKLRWRRRLPSRGMTKPQISLRCYQFRETL